MGPNAKIPSDQKQWKTWITYLSSFGHVSLMIPFYIVQNNNYTGDSGYPTLHSNRSAVSLEGSITFIKTSLYINQYISSTMN